MTCSDGMWCSPVMLAPTRATIAVIVMMIRTANEKLLCMRLFEISSYISLALAIANPVIVHNAVIAGNVY